LERFPKHVKLIAQRDVALGMFFLPFEPILRRQCVAMVEAMAELAGVQILDWHEVTIDPSALPPDSHALRTIPKVSQALFRRPPGASEEEWFATRYLLRLAVDEQLAPIAGDHFKIVSLSNRTVVYKGLSELSKIGHLYPDLQDPDFASRYLLFHSRYCTNTTTAWRRAQPFWSLAHNGEINTIEGNTEWVRAIGRDLLASIAVKHPKLARLAAKSNRRFLAIGLAALYAGAFFALLVICITHQAGIANHDNALSRLTSFRLRSRLKFFSPSVTLKFLFSSLVTS
jgi:glutamate synthase domain-containing protein 1